MASHAQAVKIDYQVDQFLRGESFLPLGIREVVRTNTLLPIDNHPPNGATSVWIANHEVTVGDNIFSPTAASGGCRCRSTPHTGERFRPQPGAATVRSRIAPMAGH